MAADSEDDLICDFAEFYHVLDWRSLPPRLAATLAAGLPDSSRSKRRMAGTKAPLETVLLAALLDQLNLWVWMHSKDGERNRNRPESVTESLIIRREEKPKIQTFQSGEDFMAMYSQITGGGAANGG